MRSRTSARSIRNRRTAAAVAPAPAPVPTPRRRTTLPRAARCGASVPRRRMDARPRQHEVPAGNRPASTGASVNERVPEFRYGTQPSDPLWALQAAFAPARGRFPEGRMTAMGRTAPARPRLPKLLMRWRLLIGPWRTIEVPTGDFDGAPATTTLEQRQTRRPEGPPQAA